jgi:hypothetical protein
MARQQSSKQTGKQGKGRKPRSKNPIRPQIDVQKHLKGVDYPATRMDLIEHARDSGAPDDVISLLQGMPEKEYRTPIQVTEAISKEL